MFAKLKHDRLQKKFDKTVVTLSKTRVVSQKQIKTIGILTTEELYFQSDFEKKTKDILGITAVKICCYRKFNKQDTPSIRFFNEKSINWKGQYIDQNFTGFLNESFDLLIGFFDENHLLLENAVLHSKATFKAGFSAINPLLYELEIAEKISNVDAYCKELKKYLLVLQKLKN